MTKLTSDAVHTIMRSVLFKSDEVASGEIPEGAVVVDGLMRKFAFHPERLETAKPEINALLSELPETFRRDKGGGWSFLNACIDKDGEQWGEHRDIEELICLGIGVGSASWLLREMADVLPGGVPYLEVHP